MHSSGLWETAPAAPVPLTPARRPGSVRRTSTLDTHWPDGFDRPMIMRGRARDILTTQGPAYEVLIEDTIRIQANRGREIVAIEGNRQPAALNQLVGMRGGGHLRTKLAEVMPEEVAAASPLHLLLDDFSGASLVSGWGIVRGRRDIPFSTDEERRGHLAHMENICTGFQTGASSLAGHKQNTADIGDLLRSEDPEGWHELVKPEDLTMRRARRMDIWREGDLLRMDIAFQDSAYLPDSKTRVAIHEYKVDASADIVSLTLQSVTAHPHVLPYRECPGAAANVGLMRGTSLAAVRLSVPATLSGILGCTHLNDVLRSMADAPRMASKLVM